MSICEAMMSTYCEEAAMAHGAANPVWSVLFKDNWTGESVTINVYAFDLEPAINKATDRINHADLSKPAPVLNLVSAKQQV
jgi:hypothetical protein